MYLYQLQSIHEFFCLLLLVSVLNIHLVGGAIFPRVYYSWMPNSLKSGGCQIPCGDAKIPREFYSGMPNPLGYHIPCDTGFESSDPLLNGRYLRHPYIESLPTL